MSLKQNILDIISHANDAADTVDALYQEIEDLKNTIVSLKHEIETLKQRHQDPDPIANNYDAKFEKIKGRFTKWVALADDPRNTDHIVKLFKSLTKGKYVYSRSEIDKLIADAGFSSSSFNNRYVYASTDKFMTRNPTTSEIFIMEEYREIFDEVKEDFLDTESEVL